MHTAPHTAHGILNAPGFPAKLCASAKLPIARGAANGSTCNILQDSIYNELKKNTVTSAKIALSCKISSQDTMTDSKVRSDSIIVFYALELV